MCKRLISLRNEECFDSPVGHILDPRGRQISVLLACLPHFCSCGGANDAYTDTTVAESESVLQRDALPESIVISAVVN